MNGLTTILGKMTRRQGNLVGAATCASMMGAALFFQHGLKLEPCSLCILQRIATISIGLVFLVAAVHDPERIGARIYGVIVAIIAAAGASISARQVWLQNLPPDQVPECGPGLDYMMDVFPFLEAMQMVLKGSGECAEVVWRFLGLSMPAWVLICLVCIGIAGVTVNWMRRTPL